METELLYRCPFCTRHTSVGVIAVDLHALVREATAVEASDEPVLDEVEWSADERRRIFVFNPDGVPNQPCPHVISFILDAWTEVSGEDGEFEQPFSHSVVWDHPWFAANDPGHRLEEYLWSLDLGTPQPAFYPAIRYEIDPVRLERPVPGSPGRGLHAAGTVIVTLDVQQFLGQLRDGAARRDAFQRSGLDRPQE